MQLKKLSKILLLLTIALSGIGPLYAYPKAQPHKHSKPSLEKQYHEMQKRYGAQPCTNQALLKRFYACQTKLGITPQLPLFSVTNPPKGLPKGTVAFYAPDLQTVTIVANSFFRQGALEQDHTLYHELRHHLQHTTSQAYNAVLTYASLKKLNYRQALEYDADNFGVRNATNNCPDCLQELKSRFSPSRPFMYYGYFTQSDFTPILQEARQQPHFCPRHSLYKNYYQMPTQQARNTYKPKKKHYSYKELYSMLIKRMKSYTSRLQIKYY